MDAQKEAISSSYFEYCVNKSIYVLACFRKALGGNMVPSTYDKGLKALVIEASSELFKGWHRIKSGSIVGSWLIHGSVNFATCMMVSLQTAV